MTSSAIDWKGQGGQDLLPLNKPEELAAPFPVTPVDEYVALETEEEALAEPPNRGTIIREAEHARAGCWMFSTVILFFVICCVLIGNGLAWATNVIPTATASAVTPTPTPTIPTLVVGDVELSNPLPAPGVTIGIWVNVDRPTDVEITYQWTHPEGKGEILEGQGTNSIKYQTPTESGTYKIGVEVTAAGVVFKRTRFITTVGNANGR